MSLKENTLRDATVLNSVFQNVKSIVVKVVVNGALADSIVLVRILHNRLLEVGLEMKHLNRVVNKLMKRKILLNG